VENAARQRAEPVATEPLDVAREVIGAFNETGWDDPDPVLRYLHDDVVWLTAEGSVESPEYIGHDGVRRYFAMVADALADFRAIPEDFIDLGEGTVVAFVRLQGTGRGSGFPFEREGIAYVFSVREGKVARCRWFEDRQQALDWARAVG
jgi:ketosteroid isomerase-like protein